MSSIRFAALAALVLCAGAPYAQTAGAADPRVGLAAGVHDAGMAAMGLELVGFRQM